MPLELGLYESIVTAMLDRELVGEPHERRALNPSEAARRLADHFGALLERVLNTVPKAQRPERQVALVNELLAVVERYSSSFPVRDDAVSDALLTRVTPSEAAPVRRPQLPLAESGLYVNANRERSLEVALARELESADRVDLICAFLFWSGYLPLRRALGELLARGCPLRVLTTTYRGVTQARVLDELSDLGADVRVSYEVGNTRLHAKAWLIGRQSGFSTAHVGSWNLSRSALTAGREWNVRLSAIENRAVLDELRAAFENHWADTEFVPYDAEQFRRETRAQQPRGELRAVFELRPRTFQKQVLERLTAERELHDRHRNLVVSATGTGKTVIAALDYARLCAAAGRRLRLLFVAHRKEILLQSRDVFRHAVSDGSYGELYVDGDRPIDGDHVFASVQSLAPIDLVSWARDHFDVLIIDEFHHATAPTYDRLLQHFRPAELLGLTATPERSDGRSVLDWFDGRIASELRIWDAIERGQLVPFQYFATHDATDLRSAWKRGKYDLGALEGLYTGHHARAHLIVEAIRENVLDATQMRALAFCVGVEHAAFMQRAFERAGIASALVVGTTPGSERREALRRLRDGELACVVTVDVFNEGVDIPEVDTILFLRPTDSATLFLQQLGRGLRVHNSKRCLTVLDFVGHTPDGFRYIDRFRALVGRVGRKELKAQVEAGFPYLPPGCSIQMDRVSQEIISANIASGLKLDRRSLAKELAASGETSLAGFLRQAGLELDELYRGGRTFSDLRRIVGLECPAPGPHEGQLGKGLGRVLHVDDRERISAWRRWLAGGRVDGRYELMLVTTLLGRESAGDLAAAGAVVRAHVALCSELGELLTYLEERIAHMTLPFVHASRLPLRVHGTYRLNEIMASLGDVRKGRLYSPREGVHFDQRSRCNLLFVTVHKDEDDYSPSTMYADYALDERRFHWQSQSGTRPDDKKGRRHVEHEVDGVTPLLFVRMRQKDDRNEREPYRFLGPVRLLGWSGERPMSVEWGLEEAMPAEVLRHARVVG